MSVLPQPRNGVVFYTVANAPYFTGAVALLNSLRRLGHHEPFVLLDAGLTEAQRGRIRCHVELLPAPEGVPLLHLAPYAVRMCPAEIQVLLDADVIATHCLAELFESARSGHFVGFINNQPNDLRFFESWQHSLKLPPVRRRPYLNSGQFVFPGAMNDRLVAPWIDGLCALTLEGSGYGRPRLSDPFYFPDQDVVNAVLGAHLVDDELDIRPHRLAPHPPFFGVRLSTSVGRLCEYDNGEAPYFLHHTMAKPWLSATRRSVYADLLSKLLLSPDAEVRLDPSQLPRRLRPGALGTLDRARAHLQAMAYTHARRRAGVLGIRTRLEDRRRRRRAP